MPPESDSVDNSSFDPQLDRAKQFAKDDDHLAALEIYESVFQQGLRSRRLYEDAAFSTTVAILDSRLSDNWAEVRRNDLYKRLILQPERFDAALAFHHQVASKHFPGQTKALATLARELRPALSALFDAGVRDKHVLLMVLLLRNQLPGWQSDATISAWHLDLLPAFDINDMSIPYNCMFDAETFGANVRDIAGLLNTTPMEDLARRFGPWKLIFFQCIARSPRLDAALPDALEACLMRAEAADANDAAGLRSLVLRAVAQGQVPPAGRIADARLAAFAADWAELCAPLRHPPEWDTSAVARARLRSRPWQAAQALRHRAVGVAPFLKIPGRRRPRIALCISGQLRGYRHAFANWRAELLRDVEIIPFVHSWTKIGRSGAEPIRAYLPFEGAEFCEAYRTYGLQLGLDEMMARYPSLFRALTVGGEVTTEEIGAFYNTDDVVLEDDRDPGFSGWSNSKKMHYKIAAADGLARQAVGDEVDLVLRLRPDKQLGTIAFGWPDLLAAARSAPVIYADAALGYQYSNLLIGDQFAIGAPGPMRIYADTINLAPSLAELGAFACPRDGFHGHISLAVTCWHAGIAVERIPVRMGPLLEAEPLSAIDIAQCLAIDSSARADSTDRALIAANDADLRQSIGFR